MPTSEANHDDRAAIRAFLQRSEVRLSTLHRIAGAFLSGAGLLVVLPLVAKDSLVGPVRTMLHELVHDFDAPTAMLLAVFLAALALPMMSLYLLFKDIALFYFTGHHLATSDPDHHDVFYPRFILAGLKMPTDDHAPGSLDEARHSEDLLRGLMPASDAERARTDRRARAYLQATPQSGAPGDSARRELLMQFSASADRALAEEAVGMEFSLARHIFRLRLMVLRYIKAVLALVTTAGTIFAAGTLLGEAPDDDDLRALAGVFMVWAPIAAAAVSLPARWIFDYAASDDQRHQRDYRNDRELLYFEDRALWLTAASFAAALAAAIVLLGRASRPGDALLIGVAILGALSFAGLVRRNGGFRTVLPPRVI